MLFWPVLLLVLAAVAGALTNWTVPFPGTELGLATAHVYAVVLVTGTVAGLALRAMARGGVQTLQNLAIVAGLTAGLFTAYQMRHDARDAIDVARSALMPSVAMSRADGEAELRRAWDGHYRADAQVNGVVLRTMIDTGASMVLIPYEEAASIGVDVESLEYSMPVATANGRSSVAPIKIGSIKIGQIAVFDVPAAVAHPGKLKTALLGMSFIDRLSETSFRGDRLIMRQEGSGPIRTVATR